MSTTTASSMFTLDLDPGQARVLAEHLRGDLADHLARTADPGRIMGAPADPLVDALSEAADLAVVIAQIDDHEISGTEGHIADHLDAAIADALRGAEMHDATPAQVASGHARADCLERLETDLAAAVNANRGV